MEAIIEKIKRKFLFIDADNEKVPLPDPGSHLTPKEVMYHYSGQYPELVNSKFYDKGMHGDQYLYEFSIYAGTKG